MKGFLPAAVFVVLSFVGFSQDKLVMLSGHELVGTVIDQTDSVITFEQTKGNKTKTKTFESFRVFSVVKAEKETIIYKRDTLKGNYLSVEDMRFFIWGAQDAMKSYNNKWAFYSGIGVGAVGGFILSQSFFVVAVPVVYSVATSLHKVKIKDEYVRDLSLLEQPAYVAGFQKNTQTSRFFQTLKGSLIGTAVGMAAGYAAN